jgi:aspartyl-tRNA(Asn)/glutamyl-tRNA(Gln) amidotransferase subunit A
MPIFDSLQAVQSALRAGTVTCRSLVEHYLRRIEATRHLNAYVEVWADEALDQAEALDQRIQAHDPTLGPLFGAVVSLKDNICYAGHVVTAASRILEGFESLYSATAVERIVAADAILIGRTNCDQFGMGSSNENSVYGPVKHPLDPTRVPGGSSGGAAVAVQTDTCLVALGSDTGGSVRQPAAFCGVWGFKPSYGRISRHGLIAYGSSFDQIGFLAHNPDDIAAFLAVCAGPDDYDSTALQAPFFLEKNTTTRPLRIAYFSQTIENESVDSGVRAVTQQYIDRLRAGGHTVESTDGFDLMDYVIPAYYVLTTAEASSNLARYDGIRYGYRAADARSLDELYLRTRTEGFSDEVKRRILLGTFVLSSGYYDAYYTKAQRVRRRLQQQIEQILATYDCILLPAAPDVAWRFGEKSADPTAMYLSDVFTVLANLVGVPAIALPAGVHPKSGLPVGVQLMGAMWQENTLLRRDLGI